MITNMNRLFFLRLFVFVSLLFIISCNEKEKEIEVQSIAISQTSVEMEIGETLSLKTTVSPSNATYDFMAWTSTNPNVASVSGDGLVSALSEGNTTITVMAGGKAASCSVTVVKGIVAVSSISLNKSSLEMVEGDTETLTASVSPEDATDKTVTWTSSNENVATVNEGVVLAVSDGETTITAKAGDETAECKVVVSSFVVFEDAVFKAYCVENYDFDGDGEISLGKESDVIKTINCNNMGITSLKGIECFRYLEVLNCQSNQLASLDVTNCSFLKDLRCSVNQLTNLDVHGLSELQILFCDSNQLSALDVRGCSALQYLYCDENQLTSLVVSECVDLQSLGFSENQIASIDLKNCVALKVLDCTSNQLTCLDLSNCPSLLSLWCSNNALTELNLKGCSHLYDLFCGSNALTKLELNDCISYLENLYCYNNQLTTIDLSGFNHLQKLSCEYNLLTSLVLSGCTDIKRLYCSHNNLASLDVSECAVLMEVLHCSVNSFLEEVWLRVGQSVDNLYYDSEVTTVKYKEVIFPVQAVDLGIVISREDGTTYKLYWADKNLGAAAPEENGCYYAWGETDIKQLYRWSTYKWANGAQEKITKYCSNTAYWDGVGAPDNKTCLDPEDDVAHVKLGGSWRMPTKEEQDALREQCIWTLSSRNGKQGYEIKSKDTTNPNSIFLPFAGWYSNHVNLNKEGYYWSSSVVGPSGVSAYSIDISANLWKVGMGYRSDGISVRPVYAE